MFTYRDRTFCVNKNCKKKCNSRLTKKIEEDAKRANMPLAYAIFDCDKEEEDETAET